MAEVHVITILLGQVAWQFNYLTPSEADKAHKKIAKAMDEQEVFDLEDEFGQKAHIDGGKISAHQRCDYGATMEASQVLNLISLQTQAEFNRKVQTDPKLMFLLGARAAPGKGGILLPPGTNVNA